MSEASSLVWILTWDWDNKCWDQSGDAGDCCSTSLASSSCLLTSIFWEQKPGVDLVPLSILAAQSAILSMADQQSRLILSCLPSSAMMVVGLTAADCIALQVAGPGLHTPPVHATDTPDFLEPRHPAVALGYTLTVTQHWQQTGLELAEQQNTSLSLPSFPPSSLSSFSPDKTALWSALPPLPARWL